VGRRFALLRELEAHDPPEAERWAHARLVTLLSEPGDPFSRYRFDPGHITAGGLVVSPEGDAVLLIHHRRLRAWLAPGGHVDPADDLVVDAARREVTEETGVGGLSLVAKGVFTVDAHPIPPHRSEPPHTHFNVVYAFRAARSELAPTDEVLEARWQPLDTVAELTTDRAILRATRKLAALV
jgi:8-oxo-dGTP pyrophosphatase MutT (NUDIX family)